MGKGSRLLVLPLLALTGLLLGLFWLGPLGRFTEEVLANGPPPVQLEPGWNLIGWTTDTAVVDAVADLSGDFTTIAAYDAETSSFRRYEPDGPATLNTLSRMENGAGLWIRVPQATEWQRPAPRTAIDLPLRAGFNLVAWLGDNRTPVQEAIAGIADAVRSVWTFDASRQTFLRFEPSGLAILNELIVLDYGDGVWLEMARPASWSQEPPGSVARQWNEELLQAIRIDFPAPTVHARNLFHLAVAMYDCWAAYDAVSSGYLERENVSTGELMPAQIAAAREEAISYAAYRLLTSRFDGTISAATTLAALDARMEALGYDPANTSTSGDSPAALGNRIAAALITHGLADGSNEANGYEDTTGYQPANEPLVFGLPGTEMADANRWQPLAFDFLILQNGIVIGEAVQTFIGPHWGDVIPFALQSASGDPYVWSAVDPGPPPQLAGADDTEFKEALLTVIRYSSQLAPDDGAMIDLSPAVSGNRPLGTHDDQGYALNPTTGEPYAANVARRGDYGRVIAEFWSDGPDSETPPGHWNVLANDISADPRLERQLGGEGPSLDALEWDVKLYLALNGAMHDAAIAAWGSKAVYDYVRPISMIRLMGRLGQSSDPDGPAYSPWGLPLEPGLVELISAESTQPGERHAHLADHQGQITIRAWSAAADGSGGVRWIRAVEWTPYQAETFVTPSFPAYVSGHSTFSRAGAEVLTAFTGSAFFPGGLGSYSVPANEFLDFDVGPSAELTLQWATYFDAADEASISRLHGGIHVPADDFKGRIMGSRIGQDAFARALLYFAGTPPS